MTTFLMVLLPIGLTVIVENELWGNWADSLLEQAVEERKERKRPITTLLNVSRFIDFFFW